MKQNIIGDESPNLASESSGSLKTPELDAGPRFTAGPYEREGCTIYKLEGTGRYSGKGTNYKEDQANRFTAHVQGNRCPESEREAIAALFAAAPALYEACTTMIASLNGSPMDFAGMLKAHRKLDAAVALADGQPVPAFSATAFDEVG